MAQFMLFHNALFTETVKYQADNEQVLFRSCFRLSLDIFKSSLMKTRVKSMWKSFLELVQDDTLVAHIAGPQIKEDFENIRRSAYTGYWVSPVQRANAILRAIMV
jgi:hypothetical protein